MTLRVRIKYSKRYPATLIGHLDTMGVFQRGMRMAGWPLEFTRGFNPRIKLSSGPPLSLGVSSNAEYLDVALRRRMSAYRSGLLKEKLIEGLEVVDISEIEKDDPGINTIISGFDYQVIGEVLEKNPPFSKCSLREKDGEIFVRVMKVDGNIANPSKVSGLKGCSYKKIKTLFVD
ncbi:MAG: DUF2344 domain-containing protein [Elusimicrobia bacterium]|nr:DUF2344 domain-containing protein [Elusimicrobiota bacterium]